MIAGIAFLLLAIVGQLAGQIAVPPERQHGAALLGGGLLLIGLALHIIPQLPPERQGWAALLVAGLLTIGIALYIVPLLRSGVTPRPSPVNGPQPRPLVASTAEKEPNDHITTATVIAEETTVHGSIGTDQDQDFFTFKPSTDKTRVILRTKSDPGFAPIVIVYNHVEKMLAMHAASVYQPATFSFASTPGATYYLMVKPVVPSVRGNYELVVRKE